jgi:hypothetical protein
MYYFFLHVTGIETSREENGKDYYNTTHKEYARRKNWTTPKEGTRKINKSLKTKNLENDILKIF